MMPRSLTLRRCGALSIFLVVATVRGLPAPLPEGCDALLDRYTTDCYLPRLAVDEDGELVRVPGDPAPACPELRAALDAGCVRWRDAKIGLLFHAWWAEHEAVRARQEDAERARWATIPACPRESFRRRRRADCG